MRGAAVHTRDRRLATGRCEARRGVAKHQERISWPSDDEVRPGREGVGAAAQELVGLQSLSEGWKSEYDHGVWLKMRASIYACHVSA